MIKIAVCDDEPLTCGLLHNMIEDHLKKYSQSFRINCYSNGENLPDTGYDILLLDIQMPGINGIELARRIRKNGNPCAIIFITVIKERVFDAFEVEAVDYLCKPIDATRLSRALDRAIQHIRKRESQVLFIQTMNWCKTVKLDSILYCEVINRKIFLHTKEGVIEYYSRLSDVEKQLDSRFVKCHRSYLVNLDFLSEYSKDSLTLTNGETIPVSQTRRKHFMEQLLHCMKNEVESWPLPPQE